MSARAGGDEGFTAWHERLALATRRYSKVVLVGDSMVRRLPPTWQRLIGSVTFLWFTARCIAATGSIVRQCRALAADQTLPHHRVSCRTLALTFMTSSPACHPQICHACCACAPGRDDGAAVRAAGDVGPCVLPAGAPCGSEHQCCPTLSLLKQ